MTVMNSEVRAREALINALKTHYSYPDVRKYTIDYFSDHDDDYDIEHHVTYRNKSSQVTVVTRKVKETTSKQVKYVKWHLCYLNNELVYQNVISWIEPLS